VPKIACQSAIELKFEISELQQRRSLVGRARRVEATRCPLGDLERCCQMLERAAPLQTLRLGLISPPTCAEKPRPELTVAIAPPSSRARVTESQPTTPHPQLYHHLTNTVDHTTGPNKP
jgi:hypothetical protein